MDEEHKRLQSKVLSNRHLMAQSSRSIRSIHEFILEACDDTLESLDQAGLLERVAKALHEAKLHTAHLCWHEIVEPLRAHQKRLQAGQEAMRSQLTQLRTAYLKERCRSCGTWPDQGATGLMSWTESATSMSL
ncbi:unnamed protein product [Effrenium voratum]|nr:unnamed protein product [Effrenium voratum]